MYKLLQILFHRRFFYFVVIIFSVACIIFLMPYLYCHYSSGYDCFSSFLDFIGFRNVQLRLMIIPISILVPVLYIPLYWFWRSINVPRHLNNNPGSIDNSGKYFFVGFFEYILHFFVFFLLSFLFLIFLDTFNFVVDSTLFLFFYFVSIFLSFWFIRKKYCSANSLSLTPSTGASFFVGIFFSLLFCLLLSYFLLWFIVMSGVR